MKTAASFGFDPFFCLQDAGKAQAHRLDGEAVKSRVENTTIGRISIDILSIGLIPGITTMGDVGSFNALTIISSLGFVIGLILTLIPTKR